MYQSFVSFYVDSMFYGEMFKFGGKYFIYNYKSKS